MLTVPASLVSMYSELEEIVGTLSVNPKTLNNYLIPLRGVFGFAMKDGAISRNPATGIENVRVQRSEPDPFDPDEADAIISDLAKHEHAQYANYFQAAFYAGFRPSEEIAIQWSDVDFKRRSVRIERAVVRARAKDSTKTYLARDVELNQRAWDAFMAQKEYTRDAELEVFWNPSTSPPGHDIQMQWRIRRRSLCRLGIRYREPYQTRHNFATMALMAGTNPAWIARQMGNSPQIVFKTYARWIEGADRGRERDKMDAAIVERHQNRHHVGGG